MFIKMVALCGNCGYIFNDFAISENTFEYGDGRVEKNYTYHPNYCPECNSRVMGITKDIQFPDVKNEKIYEN